MGVTPTCIDQNECASSPCKNNSHCINTPGSYKCQCNSGYILQAQQCVAAPCQKPTIQNGQATVQGITATYKCNPGFQLKGTINQHCNLGKWSSISPTCQDIDECSKSIDDCQQQCINTPGSYQCQCYSTWILSSDKKSCYNCPGGCLNGGKCTAPNTCHCATGFSGNNCNIKACPHIPTPLNGLLKCRVVERNLECEAKCKDGFDFAIPPKPSYECRQANLVTGTDPNVPDCTAIYPADITTNLTATFNLSSTASCATVTQDQITIAREAVNTAKTVCNDSLSDCSKVNIKVLQVLCTSYGQSSNMSVVYGLTADYNGQLFTRQHCDQSCQQKKLELIDDVNSVAIQLESAFNLNPNMTLQVSNFSSHYANQSTKFLQPSPVCSQPYRVLNDTRCQCCPAGSFSGNGQCIWCPIGTYQQQECQTTCNSCPPGETTKTKGARSKSDCGPVTKMVYSDLD